MSSQPDSENPEIDDPADARSPAAEADPLLEAEKRSAALKEQLLRTTADFDNFRKRSRREAEDAFVNGRDAMLKDLLPVFDNLERAVGHAGAAQDITSLVSGIQMVTRQFADTLKRSGIERVPTVGVAFDPTIHEAIQQVETNDFPAGTIAAEVQAGYRLGERLFRPALVVVAKAKAAAESVEAGEASNQS